MLQSNMLESRKKTAYRRLAASAHLRETWGCAWPRGLVVGPALSDRPDGTSLLPVQRPVQHVVAHPGRAARARWTIETTIEERKGEAGVDEYEVRYWHSCHRHITLSVMAHAWLASIRQPVGGNPPDPEMGELSVPEVRRLLEIALPAPPRSPQLRLAWPRRRRAKREQARHGRYGTRGAPWPHIGIHRNRAPQVRL